jgi:membrane-bound lytic murein transglycosylase D
VAQIVKTPEAYGVDLRPVLNQPFFRAITLQRQVDMPQAASIAGVSLKEFYQLNPGFKRQFTDPEGPHRLLVPAGLPSDFEADIAALPLPHATLAQTYKVKRGDTLFKVARQFGMSPQALRDLNQLPSDKLPLGRVLTIARGNVSPEYLALRQEMKLDRSPLAARQVVKSKIYKVKRGDTLGSVARRHGLSVKALARLNGLGMRAKLRPGQVLTLKQVKATQVARGKAPKGMRRITHKVRKGDTLSSIGQRYHVSVKQITSWNGRQKKLKPGQGLVIYVAARSGKRSR